MAMPADGDSLHADHLIQRFDHLLALDRFSSNEAPKFHSNPRHND
jgi:hypothetical protein